MGEALFVIVMMGMLIIPLAVATILTVALYHAIFKGPKLALVAAEPGLPKNVSPIRPSPVDVFLRQSTWREKPDPLGLGDVEVPPVHKKRVVISLDEIKKTDIESRYPYEGQCPCRIIYLGSYGVLKDVTVRCERCGQPFVFQYPL